MSNSDAEAIGAKLEQGINKNAKHIFRNRQGHFSEDNSQNRQLFLDTVMTSENYLGLDKYGTKWYGQTLSTGQQIWVQVRNGEIRNAGYNLPSKTWHSETGFSRPDIP
jgi:hypothetical protein